MKNLRWLGVLALASVPVFTSWACSGEQGSEESASSSESALKGKKTGSTTPVIPDNETAATFDTKSVGSIAIVLNDDEVTQSTLASSHAKSDDVKNFANRLVTERQESLKTLEAIQGFDDNPQETLDVTSAKTDRTAGEFARTDGFTTNDLQGKNGEDFDFSYMTAEINNQAKLLSLIDRSLLPSLRNQQTSGDAQDAAAPVAGANTALQTELTRLRGLVATDLVDALNLQKVIRDTEPGGGGGRNDAGADSGNDAGQPDAAQDAGGDAEADGGADAETDAQPDTGTPDTGTPDTGTPDTGTPDTGGGGTDSGAG